MEDAQGSVVAATLQSALDTFNSNKDSLVVETPAGNVSVLKLGKTGQSSGPLVFTFDASGPSNYAGTFQLHLPASLVEDTQTQAVAFLV